MLVRQPFPRDPEVNHEDAIVSQPFRRLAHLGGGVGDQADQGRQGDRADHPVKTADDLAAVELNKAPTHVDGGGTVVEVHVRQRFAHLRGNGAEAGAVAGVLEARIRNRPWSAG